MHMFKVIAIGIVVGYAGQLLAQQPVAYPAKGQSPSKQSQDESACRSWTQSQTGISAQTANQAPAQQTGPAVGGGQRVGGALRGAAAGAVVGGVANNNAGHGAAVGAGVGVLAGGVRARRQQRAGNEASASHQAQTLATYNQAYGACMKGRGYTLN